MGNGCGLAVQPGLWQEMAGTLQAAPVILLAVSPADHAVSEWLDRSHGRPLLDLFLFAQEIVNLSFQLLGARTAERRAKDQN